jgi:hypothetical protein
MAVRKTSPRSVHWPDWFLRHWFGEHDHRVTAYDRVRVAINAALYLMDSPMDSPQVTPSLARSCKIPRTGALFRTRVVLPPKGPFRCLCFAASTGPYPRYQWIAWRLVSLRKPVKSTLAPSGWQRASCPIGWGSVRQEPILGKWQRQKNRRKFHCQTLCSKHIMLCAHNV